MGHFDAQDTEDGEPLYCAAPQNPKDIIWAGSDTEQTQQEIREKRLRYEKHARRYLRGQLPVLQSASLRGPLEKDWVNPWRYRPRQNPDWWQPGSKDMLFTRANVMKWAADAGLGYLGPKEALARCKAAAEAESSQAHELHNSSNADDSGNTSGIEDQSDDSEDPLSQGDDLVLSRSDPFHEGSDGSEIPSNIGGSKRRANVQWLKGPYISKRAKWDSPAVASPTPVFGLPGEGRRQRGGPPRAKTPTTARIFANGQSKSPRSDDKYSRFERGELGQEEDVDELADISGGTTFVSAVGLYHEPKKAPKEPPTTTSASRRKLNANRVESGSIKAKSFPRSAQDSAASDIDVLADDSFITEVAPSSGNVETFKYRKRRKELQKSQTRTSTEREVDMDGQRAVSSKSSEHLMAMEPDEESLNPILISDDDDHPEKSPNDEISQESEKHPIASSPPKFLPAEEPPMENTAVTEPSPVNSIFSSSWAVVDRINSPAGHSSRSNQSIQLSMRSKLSMPQSSSEPNNPETHTQEEHVDGRLSPSVRDDDSTQSDKSSQSPLRLVLDGQIVDHSLESMEEIVQSQIRAEMGLSSNDEESLTRDTEKEEQLSQKPPSHESNRATQNSSKGDKSCQSHISQVMVVAEDAEDAACNAATTDAGNSTPHGHHREQDSYQERGLQSPWVAEPSQLVPAVGVRNEPEQGVIGSKPSGTQDGQPAGPDDSAEQQLARPQTPDHDGIIPFRNFMTPTPSPKLVRGRPSLGGFTSTQTLIDAATSNPWGNSQQRRSKKRVSFGLLEEEDEDENIPKERPLSPPPPPASDRPGEDEDDGTTAEQFQKHFAAVGGDGQRGRPANVPFPRSPAVSAMADAFIEADRSTSAEQGRSRHLQPISAAMTNMTGDSEGSPSTSEARAVIDLDGFLGEAGGFLEEWSVETELKRTTTEDQSRGGGGGEERRRVLGGVW